MTYNEAIEYLNSFVNYEEIPSYDYKASFKLGRMRSLSELLGDPHKDLKTIHITGTKGKGSTAAIISSILKAANIKTGLYTSPHLISFRERIKVDDIEISEDEVAGLIKEVKSAVDKSKNKTFTFFELYTAVAFLYFKMKKVDVAVIEVGLGGRLDATNLVEPLMACITPISLEHTHLLGPTLRDIAKEKAAIIKKGSVCVSGPQADEVNEIIESECARKGVRLYRVGRDIFYEGIKTEAGKEVFNVIGIFGEYPYLEMKLLGEHQLVNAATAIGIIEGLRAHNIVVPASSIKDGLRSVEWPARLETVSRQPAVVLDGAQNKASAVALKNAMKRAFKYNKLILILGISKDKDIPEICRELDEVADEVILTKANIIRAEDPGLLREHINKNSHITGTVDDAIKMAKSIAKKDDLILITGSFFVAGEAKQILQNAKN